MKIISYNVNGLRSAIRKGLLDWLAKENPDIALLQEIKLQREQARDNWFHQIGYPYVYWNFADKKGYSGTLTLSKYQPKHVETTMHMPQYDAEGRSILTVFDHMAVLNLYIPSGSVSEQRHQFKMQFLHDFEPYLRILIEQYPQLIVGGDFNIVHTEKDIHNPERKDNPSGYRPEERAWLDHVFKDYLVDVFRYLHPDTIEFSWWSYRAASRQRNKGWRIDYIAVTPPLLQYLRSARHAREAVHSDHCPVVAEFDNLL